MPSKNEEKIYIEDGIYHIYNRGVNKRAIFFEQIDYSVFLSYIKTYLSPKDHTALYEQLSDSNEDYKQKQKILRALRLNNFYNKLSLLCYCLMPNHFHFLIYQKERDTIIKFMNSLITRYVMYFNKKYKRIGPLFQGVYKAVLVDNDEQLLHISRYIHSQSFYDKRGNFLTEKQPSSYNNYIGKVMQKWISTERILGYFQKEYFGNDQDEYRKQQGYKKFIEGKIQSKEIDIYKLLLD